MPAPPGLLARLVSQQLAVRRFTKPADLVRWMGAVQAQDAAGAAWGIGLRLAEGTEAVVDAAIADRSIVRTWPMRGTLHYVPAADVRWMLRLLNARREGGEAAHHRALGLDAKTFARAARVLSRALEGGRRLTRPAVYQALARGGVSPEGQRGIHVVGHLAQQGLLCCGPREGQQPTFVLLEEWVPPAREPSREKALATLATRYFTSHGPATEADLAWWCGVGLTIAREAIAQAGDRLERDARSGRVRSAGAEGPAPAKGPVVALLPPWDELLVAYRDRMGAFDGAPPGREPVRTLGSPLVVVDGRARGAWKRSVTRTKVRLDVVLWAPVSRPVRRALDDAIARYARFVRHPVEARVTT